MIFPLLTISAKPKQIRIVGPIPELHKMSNLISIHTSLTRGLSHICQPTTHHPITNLQPNCPLNNAQPSLINTTPQIHTPVSSLNPPVSPVCQSNPPNPKDHSKVSAPNSLPESSTPPPILTTISTHPMVTRNKSEICKPKVWLSTTSID